MKNRGQWRGNKDAGGRKQEIEDPPTGGQEAGNRSQEIVDKVPESAGWRTQDDKQNS